MDSPAVWRLKDVKSVLAHPCNVNRGILNALLHCNAVRQEKQPETGTTSSIWVVRRRPGPGNYVVDKGGQSLQTADPAPKQLLAGPREA